MRRLTDAPLGESRLGVLSLEWADAEGIVDEEVLDDLEVGEVYFQRRQLLVREEQIQDIDGFEMICLI